VLSWKPPPQPQGDSGVLEVLGSSVSLISRSAIASATGRAPSVPLAPGSCAAFTLRSRVVSKRYPSLLGGRATRSPRASASASTPTSASAGRNETREHDQRTSSLFAATATPQPPRLPAPGSRCATPTAPFGVPKRSAARTSCEVPGGSRVESAMSYRKDHDADLALDRHHCHCCACRPWLLRPWPLLEVAAQYRGSRVPLRESSEG
jgi:hypothetical protein